MSAGNGFFDNNQNIYLPKDSFTWADLATSPYGTWDSYTSWYQNLTGATELTFQSDIYDYGTSRNLLPLLNVHMQSDGGSETLPFTTNYPRIVIEGSNNSDMSSSTSATVTRASPTYTSIGAFRYYRFTVSIETGPNNNPRGFTGFEFQLLDDTSDEVLENINTATYDDGSTATRTIPTRTTYGAITYVGITPTGTVSDSIVTGVGGGGGGSTTGYTLIDYVASAYVVGPNSANYVTGASSTSVTTSTITTVPLAQLVSTNANSFTIRVIKPATGEEVDSTFTFLVRGIGTAAVDINGDLIRTT